MRPSLNHILRKYVQEHKDDLKIMDEDEDVGDGDTGDEEEDRQINVREIEDMIREVNRSIDEGLLGGINLGPEQVISFGGADENRANHNNSMASFLNDAIKSDSPDLVSAVNLLSPLK
jgi:hypothetical protein